MLPSLSRSWLTKELMMTKYESIKRRMKISPTSTKSAHCTSQKKENGGTAVYAGEAYKKSLPQLRRPLLKAGRDSSISLTSSRMSALWTVKVSGCCMK
jgi:hypothetical protein